MRKAGIWLGLIEDEDDRGYNGYEESDEFAEEQAPARVRGAQRSTGRVGRGVEDRNPVRQLNRGSGSVTPLTRDNLALAEPAPVRAVPAEEESHANYRITTLHPTTYNEARTIGERYRDGTPVIMNLSEMEEADAKRLVDFAAGLIFGTRGSFERVTNRVFLLSPPHVQVTAEDKAKIAEGGFFNQSLPRDTLRIVNLALQLVYLALFAFYLFLLARLVGGVVVQFSRRWEPGPRAAAVLESVYSVTDPPLKGLRKVIPPLRLGSVSIDLAFLALLLGMALLMYLVERLIRG
nr:YggT family protein [Glycomyces sp. NRRL B-16210]